MQNYKTISMFLLLISSSLTLLAQEDAYNTLTNSKVENSELYRDGNAYQRDFLLFSDMLENTHPIFAETGRRHYDMDSLTRTGYQYLAGCESDGQLKQYLQSILSPLNDGHSKVSMSFDGKICPFALFADGDTAFYLTTITKEFSAELGHRVTAINGKPTREVIESFRPLMSCDNENFFMDNVNNYMQLKAAWDYNPYRRPDDMLEFQFDDGNTVLLPAVGQEELGQDDIEWFYPQKTNVPFKKSSKYFSYNIMPEKQLCYLRFSQCADRNTLRMFELFGQSHGMTEEQLAQVPDFGEFLQEMFSEMRRQGVKTLMVDVRYNGGGNSMLCDQLLSWLKPVDEMRETSSLIRVSKLWETQYPDLAKDYKEKFQKNGMTYRLGELFDPDFGDEGNEMEKKLTEMFVMNQSRDSLFTGEVLFMLGKDTFSSAGLLITSAIDNGIGTIIGENSTFAPSHYGDILYWELPNTHTQGIISHKIFVRPDATKPYESAIIPDIPLPETWEDYRDGIDPCWKWVMER